MSNEELVAIIVTEESKQKVLPGGTPTFIASDLNEQQNLARIFSRILNAMAHDLGNEVIVIAKH